MKTIEIESSDGYMLDADQNVCIKFGGWEIGKHKVPDFVQEVEYVEDITASEITLSEKYIDQ